MKFIFLFIPIFIIGVLWFSLFKKDPKREPIFALALCFIFGALFFFLERVIFRGAILKFFYSDDIFEYLFRYADDLFRDNLNTPKALHQSRILFSVWVISFIIESIRFFGTDIISKIFKKYLNDDHNQLVDYLLYSFTFTVFYGILDVYSSIELNENYLSHEKLYLVLGLIIHLYSAIILGLGFYKLRERKSLTFKIKKLDFNRIWLFVPFLICWLQHAFIKWTFWNSNVLSILVVVAILTSILYYWRRNYFSLTKAKF